MKVKLKITRSKIPKLSAYRYSHLTAFVIFFFIIIHSLSFEKYEGNNIYSANILNVVFIKEWFLSLGEKYNVNPYIFGAIYVGAIPFFTISLGWLIKRIKNKESIILPSLSAGFFFISAYIYLIIVGQNVPLWVYGIIIIMVLYGIFSTIKKIKNRVKAE